MTSPKDLHLPTGKHLLLDGSGVGFELLNDADALAHILSHAARRAGATVLQITKQQFEPQGVSVVCILAESHISIHTYPEVGAFMIDLFTCGDDCDPNKAAVFLMQALNPTDHHTIIMPRGLTQKRSLHKT